MPEVGLNTLETHGFRTAHSSPSGGSFAAFLHGELPFPDPLPFDSHLRIFTAVQMPEVGVEPTSLTAHGPKPCVFANFTTPASGIGGQVCQFRHVPFVRVYFSTHMIYWACY